MCAICININTINIYLGTKLHFVIFSNKVCFCCFVFLTCSLGVLHNPLKYSVISHFNCVENMENMHVKIKHSVETFIL